LTAETLTLSKFHAINGILRTGEFKEVNFMVKRATYETSKLIALLGQNGEFSFNTEDELRPIESGNKFLEILDDIQMLEKILKLLDQYPHVCAHILKNRSFLLITKNKASKDVTSSLLFRYQKLFGIYNMKLYLLVIDDDKLELRSIEFYTEVACKKLQMTPLSTFDIRSSRWNTRLTKNMFDTSINYHGCELLCEVHGYSPFSSIIGSDIANSMANMGNFTVKFHDVSQGYNPEEERMKFDFNVLPTYARYHREGPLIPAEPLMKVEAVLLVNRVRNSYLSIFEVNSEI
jgi:hypothetical protein